ncbi:invasion protein IalB [Thioclava sp. ES.031]|uniref:invasion associated locus B family protein n=1 Tax=Thioclava sp. ES.031 TaxID=1798203 RepID=UPI000BF6D2F3|nr:invasion associated locus B family protein [Thioclava sp. ES.031]PFG64450.1 invasion protein IalB [Thioclava sp. ES.031]
MTKMNETAGLGARITKGAAVAVFALGCLAPAAFAQTSTADGKAKPVAKPAEVAQKAAPAQSGAQADIANNTAFGDWVVSCQAATVKKTVCRLVQEQRTKSSNQLLARFIAMPAKDGAVLIAQVPMGAYLPGGAVYRFEGKDNVKQRDMVWQTCMNGVCEAAAPLSTDELKLFAENKAILFGYKPTATGKPVVLRVSVEQFNKALDVLKKAEG